MERTKAVSESGYLYFFVYLLGIMLLTNDQIKACKVMVFKFGFQGKALENHVFKTEPATDDSHCRTMCFRDDRCISYNFGMSRNNRTSMCELSDSDHVLHPEDLVGRFDTIYKSAENTCNCSKNFICWVDFTQGTHRCECKSGFTGMMCENRINGCASNPCQNGGSCQDQVNSYNCTCAAGFTGDDCQTNVDDCAENPCDNNGTCVDLVNDYNCSCAVGFTGKNCSSKEWLNTSPLTVCIGAKDNLFGKFIVPLEGHIKAIKLGYRSGDGLSYIGDKNKGYWGGTVSARTLQIFITNTNNSILAPQDVSINKLTNSYSLPGVTNMDPVLLFPNFTSPFFVHKNQSLRAWFGPDLYDFFEFDNYGTTCAEIKIMYT